MSLSVWLSLCLICVLGAMSPGPSLAVVAKNSLGGGWRHGVATAWAHAMGVGLYALACVFGLATVLQHHPIVFAGIAYAGAAYLAWLGVCALRAKGGIADRLVPGKKMSILAAAREGAMISVLNPKLALFFLALFSQFVAASHATQNQAIVVATPLLIDGLWYTFVAFILTRPLLFDRIRAGAVWVDKITGIVLIALAVRVVLVL